jgi:hypothetical protein
VVLFGVVGSKEVLLLGNQAGVFMQTGLKIDVGDSFTNDRTSC